MCRIKPALKIDKVLEIAIFAIFRLRVKFAVFFSYQLFTIQTTFSFQVAIHFSKNKNLKAIKLLSNSLKNNCKLENSLKLTSYKDFLQHDSSKPIGDSWLFWILEACCFYIVNN